MVRPPLGPGSLAVRALPGTRHLCTNHHVAFPEHLPYDHRDPTLSPWYEHRPAWEAKSLGPMTQRGGLLWNLMLGSPSPSNLPSMRIIWGTHPLQLHGPASHHPLIPQPPLRAGGGSSSLPLGPGPSVQDLTPAWSLNAPCSSALRVPSLGARGS